MNNKIIAIIATPISDFMVKIWEVAMGLQQGCNKIAIVATGIATPKISQIIQTD